MSINQENLKKALTILGVAGPDGMEGCAARQNYFVDCLTRAVIGSAKTFQSMIWQPIETAPKDGSEILGYRDDCGVLIIKYCCVHDFCQDDDIDEETLFSMDWFCESMQGAIRLEGQEIPTHWMHKPAQPSK